MRERIGKRKSQKAETVVQGLEYALRDGKYFSGAAQLLGDDSDVQFFFVPSLSTVWQLAQELNEQPACWTFLRATFYKLTVSRTVELLYIVFRDKCEHVSLVI